MKPQVYKLFKSGADNEALPILFRNQYYNYYSRASESLILESRLPAREQWLSRLQVNFDAYEVSDGLVFSKRPILRWRWPTSKGRKKEGLKNSLYWLYKHLRSEHVVRWNKGLKKWWKCWGQRKPSEVAPWYCCDRVQMDEGKQCKRPPFLILACSFPPSR